MKAKFVWLAFVVFFSGIAYAQQAVTESDKKLRMTPGTYRGDVKADNGDHAFDMVVSQSDKGELGCGVMGKGRWSRGSGGGWDLQPEIHWS